MTNITYTSQDTAGSKCVGYVYRTRTHTEPVQDYVRSAIESQRNGNDLDMAACNADCAQNAVARLVQRLVDKGIFDLDDVMAVAEMKIYPDEAGHSLIRNK